MQVHQGIAHLPAFRQAVITVGSFDGVHLGHRKLLRHMRNLADHVRGESILITFDPHPRSVVDQQVEHIPLLNTAPEKLRLLADAGLDHLVIVPFTIEFAQLTADEYVKRFLVDHFHPRYIVLGHNHRFGANRQGDIKTLRWYGQEYGYEVARIDGVQAGGAPVSSTRIRRSLANQEITEANDMLGHPFVLSGPVVQGDQLGRKLGFPTANIAIQDPDKLIPPDGVYAAYAEFAGDRYQAMLYIGRKPTLAGQRDRVIEVNLLHFNEQIYGEELWIEVMDFIRNDEQFPDTQSLQKAIQMDRKRIRMTLEEQADAQGKEGGQTSGEVAVAILNYNGHAHLQKYLPSVIQACNASGAQLYVIDNCSTDQSLPFLNKQYPDLPVIQLEQNWGFAAGYNHGLTQIEAEFYFLLNSDVDLPEGVISALVDRLQERPDLAVAQPKILADQDRTVFEYAGAAGGWLDFLGYPFCRGRIFDRTEKDEGQYDTPQEIFWASGAAFMIRSKLFHQFGGFDPQFFAHLEEIDLCWRLKRAGYGIWCESTVQVYHLGGGTLAYDTPRKAYLNFRNSLITLVKNERPLDILWKIPSRLLLDWAAILLFLSQRKWAHITAVLRAHLDFLLTLHISIFKRRYHQSEIKTYRRQNKPNLKGLYNGSVVWEFFLNNRKTFREILR